MAMRILVLLAPLLLAGAPPDHPIPLDGGHAKLTCDACHGQGPPGRISGQGGQCGGCHLPVGAPHIQPDRDCNQCHDVYGRTRFDHGGDPLAVGGAAGQAAGQAGPPVPPLTQVNRFPLRGIHAQTPCKSCHSEAFAQVKAPHGPVTGPDACGTCHADRLHKGAMGSRCASCHQPSAWADAGRFDHQGSAFPLDGVHRVTPCEGCHGPGRPGDARSGLTGECVQCHQDPHRGGAGMTCDRCHTPQTWLLTRFNHDFTNFALTGQHLAVPCRDCHKGDRFVGQPDECFTCHGNQAPRSHSFPGAWLCDECHTPQGFPLPGFVHRPSVVVSGVHARVAQDCGRCHSGGRPLDGEDCLSCHRGDVPAHHRGFLGDLGPDGRECARCHDRAAPWSVGVRFTHNFPLEGAHRGPPCSSCHPLPMAVRSGFMACRPCHEADEPRNNHPRGRDCADCHRTTGFYPAVFR